MKYLFFFISFLAPIILFSQNPILENLKHLSLNTVVSENHRAYVDANLNKVAKNKASYYRIVKYVKTENLVDWTMGTYDTFSIPQVRSSGYDRYQYNYYYLNDQLAFSTGALTRQYDFRYYEFSGAAIWYNEDGSLLAKGTFYGGKLDGLYTEYDRNGSIKTQKRYMKGKEFNANIYKPLLGEWVMVTKSNQSFHEERQTYNTFKEDGTMIISAYDVNKRSRTKRQNPAKSEVYLWSYFPNINGGGTLEMYYADGSLLQRGKLEFRRNQLRSTVNEHQLKERVGGQYIFTRTGSNRQLTSCNCSN